MWVTVKTFSSQAEAELARGYLEQNGIKARIKADNVGGMEPQLNLTSGVHVQVEEKNADEARELL